MLIKFLYLILLFNQLHLILSNQIQQRSIPNKKRTNHTNLNSIKDHFKSCGHLIKNTRSGFISSPRFPNPFPLPIYCQWVIDLSSFTANRNDNQTLIVYLNEVYIKQGLKFTEYSFFLDENLNVDKKDLSPVNFNSDQSFILTRKKYLVIQLQIDEKINHNLNPRILDSPANYNGFNLTFELTKLDDNQLLDNLNKEVCSFKKCNFNGRCLNRSVDKGLFRFKCQCFNNFHGEHCEFGPSCDPFQKKNNCLNGGSCIYSNDLTRIKCKCPEDFTGSFCEKPQFNTQSNVTDNSLYVIRLKLYDTTYEQKRKIESKELFRTKLKHLISTVLKQHNRDLNVQDVKLTSNHVVEIHLFFQIDNEEFIRKLFLEEIAKEPLGKFILFDKNYIELTSNPAFTIIGLNIENRTLFDDEIKLNCIVKGITVPNKVKWLKDGEIINFDSKFRAFKHKISFIANNIMKSIFTIQNPVYEDSGSFSCIVSDDYYELRKSVYLQLNKLQQPILNPLSITAKPEDNVTINCFTDTKDYNLDSIEHRTGNSYGNLTFGYNWLRNDELIDQLNDKKIIIQELYPTGSRLMILNITKSAEYKCILTSLLGTTSKEILVNVLDSSSSDEDYCKPEFNHVYWRQTMKNTVAVEKCPSGSVGEIKRQCIETSSQTAAWFEVDSFNCIKIDFNNLIHRIRNYFLGYGNRSYESLITEFSNKLSDNRLGEDEFLEFLNENAQNLIQNKPHFDQEKYQKVITKLLDLSSYFFKTGAPFTSNKNFGHFQNLVFKLSEQIYLDPDSTKLQRIKFKNFELVFIRNRNKSPVDIPLPSDEVNSDYLAQFNFRNLNQDEELIFIIYKLNNFIRPQNLGLFRLKSNHHTNDNLMYFAFRRNSNRKNKSNLNDTTSLQIDLSANSDENLLKCGLIEFHDHELIFTKFKKNQDCFFKFKNLPSRALIIGYSFSKLSSLGQKDELNNQTILKGNYKTAMNIISGICCVIIAITMILNLRNLRRNNCLADLQFCISLIINHFSTNALLSSDQKNENYWLMLFSLSQISALTIQFCTCVAIEHNFDNLRKSQFTKNISIKIAIVSTILPFSVVGLLYEFYYTNYNFLWTLQVGSYLFYSIVFASLFITLANLYFYIKLNTRLQPLKRENNLTMNTAKYENTSRKLTQTVIITILLNIHLVFVLLLINVPINIHSILIVGYAICSILIILILLTFKTRSTENTNSSKRNLIENLSLNKSNERKAFKHYKSNSNSNIFNCEIQSIYS